MMTKHLSLDIETMSVDPHNDAAIIAIGAVVFTRDQILDQLEILLDPMWSPGSRSQSTHEWWRQQDYTVTERMFGGETLPWQACIEFSSFVGLNGVDLIWGYPARFDIGNLRALFAACEKPFPLSSRQEMDLSTVRDLCRRAWPHLIAEMDHLKEERTAHDALSDALCQAKQIAVFLRNFGIID